MLLYLILAILYHLYPVLALALNVSAPSLEAVGNLNCVNTRVYETWSGRLNPEHCNEASFGMKEYVSRKQYYNRVFTFYSRLEPPRQVTGFHYPLPIGFRYASCVLLIRMAKDFGDNSLAEHPAQGRRQYLQTHDFSAEQRSKWPDIISAMDTLLVGCTVHAESPGLPGWTTVAGNITLAVLPASSIMRRKFGPPTRGLTGGNETDVYDGASNPSFLA